MTTRKTVFFFDIGSTHDPDTTEEIELYPICCFFPLYSLKKKNYYFVGFEGCFLPILSFLYFKTELVRACSAAHFQK